MRKLFRERWALLSLTAGLIMGACTAAPPETSGSSDALERYPRGRWRLAPHQLSKVLFSTSHIVIRHKGAAPAISAWTGALATTLDDAPQREVDQAQVLAARIATEATRDPSLFAKLAAEHSDDRVTASLGGLNGIYAASTFPPQFLDALAALKEGQVSRVIRSENGFHIIKREPLGEAELVGLSEIVIGYDGAPDLLLRPERSVTRSRAEARRMATELYEQLRAGSLTFDAAVAASSDAESALRGGDIGVWSTLDAPLLGRELAAARRLAIGEFTAPIENGDGFRILRRDQAAARPTLATEEIMITHGTPEPDADPGKLRTDAEARALAEKIIAELQLDPGAFERYQREHCCVGEERWLQGRAAATYEAVAKSLVVGSHAMEPLRWRSAHFVLKRVEPSSALSPEPSRDILRELPSPGAADLDAITAVVRGDAMGGALAALSDAAKPALGLDEPTTAKLASILRALGERIGQPAGVNRREAIDATWTDVRALLGERDFARFKSFIAQWAEGYLMAMW